MKAGLPGKQTKRIRPISKLRKAIRQFDRSNESPRAKKKRIKRELLAAKNKRITDARAKSEEFLASNEWRTLRYQFLVKHKRTCMCCGRSAPNVEIHVDHIKPRILFPELALAESNLQVLCKDCNFGKGYKNQDDFRETKN